MDSFDEAERSVRQSWPSITITQGELAKVFRRRCRPGRCGECAEATEGSVAAPSWWCGRRKIWVYDNMSCPYFKAKPDAYEELAREVLNHYADEQVPEIEKQQTKHLAGFLRSRVTLREDT